MKQGHRLYEGGRASPTAERILRFCLSFDEQLHASAVLYQRIADAGIFVDQHAQVNLPDGTKTRIGGFSIVDERKLAALPDEEFLKLRKNGVLNLVFCHLWSMRSWNNILQ